MLAIQGILKRLVAGLSTLYAERLDQVLLYGSHARGEARPDSDIDVLVVLRNADSPGKEIARTSHLVADLCLRHDCVISCLFVDHDRFERDRDLPFFMTVRRDAVAL